MNSLCYTKLTGCYTSVLGVLQDCYNITLLPGLYWTVEGALGYRSLFHVLLILSLNSSPFNTWRAASCISCYRSFSRLLQQCYCSVTVVFMKCYMSFTVLVKEFNCSTTGVLV